MIVRLSGHPLIRDSLRDRQLFGPDLIKESEQTVKLIRDRLKVAQSRIPLVAPEPGPNDDESGAHIVFGIARRVPPPNTS